NIGADFVTILAWHVNVGQNDIRPHLFQPLDCSFAIAERKNVELRSLERLRNKTADRRAVIGQQNFLSHTDYQKRGGPSGPPLLYSSLNCRFSGTFLPAAWPAVPPLNRR